MKRISLRRAVRRLRLSAPAVVTGAALLTMAMVGTAPAEANSIRVTHGDATSLFEAFGNGGWAILNHNPTQMGAPSDANLRGSIRPLAGTPWDGRHFCELDWHVILLADIEDTKAQAAASAIDFTLDGVPLASSRTTVKRYLGQGGQPPLWYVNDGAIMSPNDLAVGVHTVSVDATFFDGFEFASQITIFIDAAGTGACL
jgi:hypothetical protein